MIASDGFHYSRTEIINSHLKWFPMGGTNCTLMCLSLNWSPMEIPLGSTGNGRAKWCFYQQILENLGEKIWLVMRKIYFLFQYVKLLSFKCF